MKAFVLGIFLLMCQFIYSQDTLEVRLEPLQYEEPIIVPRHIANYPPFYYYKSLDRYKLIIPLDFKFRKNYFFYRDRKKVYKIRY